MKKHLALLACLAALHLTACTSNDAKDDATAPDETAALDQSLDGVDSNAASPDAGGSGDGFSAETPALDTAATPPADGSEAPPADAAAAGGADPTLDLTSPTDSANPPAQADAALPPSDASAGAPPAGDAGLPPPEASFSPDAGVDAGGTPPPSEASVPADAPPVADNSSPSTDQAATPSHLFDKGSGGGSSAPKVSVKKIEASPFKSEKGTLLNTVYVARPGDNYKKIAKLVYSDDKRAADLKKDNPGVKPKVGDKVYYNSPNRPDDETTMKTYYEDNGIPAETYVAQDGDNLKKVSKQLLGYDGAWKEVFATNSVDSTGKMAAGTELKYWKTPEAKTETAAATPPAPVTAPPPTEAAPAPPPETAMGGTAANELPPPPDAAVPPPPAAAPPPPADQQAAMPPNAPPPPEAAPPPPPPPPVEAAPPPPPPPPPAMAKKQPHPEEGGPMDNDIMLALGAAGLVAALLAGVMVMRKRRQQREMAAAFGDTQVGT